jgi:molecular chaperone GrpE
VSDPNAQPEPAAPPSEAGASASPPGEAEGPEVASIEDEVFEVMDVHDEMAAMAGVDGEEDFFVGDPLAVELADTLRQRDEYLDALRRLPADFENYKKRVAKQQADTAERVAASLVEKLLPALDTADLALAHSSTEEVKQIWSALTEALAGEGLERIAPDGGPFDPNRHDAVAHEPGDEAGEQHVSAVLRAGYAWKGRVLRPAMVKVRG